MAKETEENRSEDRSVLGHIDRLVKEEERLYAQHQLAEEDRARLAELKIDLLRQRRALREFGRAPDNAKICAAKVVENYEQ